jgi:hypothetical protein
MIGETTAHKSNKRTDIRPLAITCAPCRTRKISRSVRIVLPNTADIQSVIVKSRLARIVQSESLSPCLEYFTAISPHLYALHLEIPIKA